MFDDWTRKYKIKEVVENQVGCSGDGVYFLQGENQNYYAKVSRNEEILNEVKAYRYLDGKLNVPKVFEFEKREDQYFLLMSEIKGQMLYELLKEDIPSTINLYATSLKKIHDLPIEDYPLHRDLKNMLEIAKNHIAHIDINDLEEITQKRGLEETYQRLVELTPQERDLVICHGDFCMPNVLVDKKVGYIDLGRSGIDDRYQDIALALRSLKSNIEMINKPYRKEYTTLFLNTYGINQLDERKCEFYFLLDEFY